MDLVRIGLVGAGFIAEVHARALSYLKDLAEIRGIYSRSIEKTRSFAARHGIKRVYDSLRDLLRDKEIDAVIIATPSHTHREIAVEAAAEGKHIFLEKPIANSISDAEAIIREAEKRGVKLFVGHVLRYWPEYVSAREAVLRGDVGEVSVATAYRLSSFPGREWFRYSEYSGGVVVDLAIHDIDFLIWTLGSVSRVFGYGGRFTRHSFDAIDHTSYLIEFENGAVAYGEASWAMPGTFPFTTYLEIAGSRGLLVVDNRSTSTIQVYGERNTYSYSYYERDPYYNELKAFIRWILYDEPVRISPEEALESLRVALAINRSIETREIISLRRGV